MEKRAKMSEGIDERSLLPFLPSPWLSLFGSSLGSSTSAFPPAGEGLENKGIIEARARLHMPQMPI